MPIYEYKCTACGHQLDALQKISDEALTDCPTCHKAALQKLVSATSFQLKGTGWYVTDFRNKNQPENKAEPKKESENSNSASTTGGDGSSTTGTTGTSDAAGS